MSGTVFTVSAARYALYILSTLLCTLSLPVQAQQPVKIRKIGWLVTRPPGSANSTTELVTREMRTLGYVEGKNIAVEYRYADNKLDRLPALADELIRLKLDLIVTPATTAAMALKNATRTIPIVFIIDGDPVALGLVDSLARPGENLTGFTMISAVLAGKRLELLKETVPRASRIAVLWDPQNPSSSSQWKESQLPARELKLQLHSMEVSTADRYESAFKEAIQVRSAALAVTLNALANSNLRRIAELAVKHRLPAIGAREDFADSGGLMSYGPDVDESYKRTAAMVDRILKGAKPAELAVEQPTKFELVINLKAAKQIGLTIPPNVLARADRVIK
jgi:putative ABC transport system substrate-binding protein